MKLSEAIRLGAMMGPQAFGELHDGEASCALGSAMKAMACSFDQLQARLTWSRSDVQCPECSGWFYIGGAVVCLNDSHHWTRERIADWVATIEPAEVDHSAPVTIRKEVAGQGPLRPSLEEVKA